MLHDIGNVFLFDSMHRVAANTRMKEVLHDNPRKHPPLMQHSDLLSYFPVAPFDDMLPASIPSPFANSPHPLAEQAAHILQQRLSSQPQWPRDFFAPGKGKMFGVLVVQDNESRVGFLSAFSGQMNGSWHISGFVPPIFNPHEHALLLSRGKTELERLGAQLLALESAHERAELLTKILHMQQQRDDALSELKLRHKAAKIARHQHRLALTEDSSLTDEEHRTNMAALALASQHHKREAINATQHWQEKLHALQLQLDSFDQQISRLKQVHAQRLRHLHQQVYSTYRLRNHLGEQQDICDFFDDAMPPAGAGDCAGPKLIHYACHHQLQPLAMAEFWWGASPTAGIRHHGHFYPACRGKCRPILPFMLRGLALAPEPEHGLGIDEAEPPIVYEDDCLLIVNKPSGLLSTPGKHVKDSVLSRLQQRYPDVPQLKLVHRLDMETSGLLLVAKNLSSNKFLQKQFIQRRVDKRYEAVLSACLPAQPAEGEINLPLCLDLEDRPRQMVNEEHGKLACTGWRIIARDAETTRVYFYPQTGRTHQLRVHASHHDGLNAPIVGDSLYGEIGERLMLHAQRLCFTHPISRERLEFEIAAPF